MRCHAQRPNGNQATLAVQMQLGWNGGSGSVPMIASPVLMTWLPLKPGGLRAPLPGLPVR